jgi:hypothetical protein
MKRLVWLVAFVILALASVALAAGPYLVCDPQPGQGVTYYVVLGLPASIDASHISPDASGTYGFKLDLAMLPVGSYTVIARACTSWGCSGDSSPLVFSRPAAVSIPQHVIISN